MGKPNIAVNHWLSDNSRFADLFNGIVFGGEQIVRPEELEPMDREADILITDKEGREKGVQRCRDIVKRWRQGMDLAVLACESQRKVHYAMPIRNMLYDSLSYAEQARILWKERKKKQPAEGPLTGEEYLSRFGKKDTLFPVITVVFYYGLEAGSVEDLERFHTDLQPILGMLKYRGRKEELRDYIYQNRAYFGHVDKATYRAVGGVAPLEESLEPGGGSGEGRRNRYVSGVGRIICGRRAFCGGGETAGRRLFRGRDQEIYRAWGAGNPKTGKPLISTLETKWGSAEIVVHFTFTGR